MNNINIKPLVILQAISKKYVTKKKLLSIKNQKILYALDNINLTIKVGEVMGLIGESGCGKSTLGRLVLGLEKPTTGQVFFAGQDLATLNHKEIRTLRRQMQIIFQNPLNSLNPRLTIGSTLTEPFQIHQQGNRHEIKTKVENLLTEVGLRPEHAQRYPHQFSGGQRQRIGIARALALKPRLVVADEPVSALDVSIQAQIINLLMDFKEKIGLTYLFITHDLSIVRHICDRVAIMYLGKIVEISPINKLNYSQAHPYTETLKKIAPTTNFKHLFSAPPLRKNNDNNFIPLSSSIGCNFYIRCPDAQTICKKEEPQLKLLDQNWLCACHFRP